MNFFLKTQAFHIVILKENAHHDAWNCGSKQMLHRRSCRYRQDAPMQQAHCSSYFDILLDEEPDAAKGITKP